MTAKRKKITAEWLYRHGYSCNSCAAATGVSSAHISMCLRGLRNFSDALRERILSLPKRKPVTGKYMAHMKNKAAL